MSAVKKQKTEKLISQFASALAEEAQNSAEDPAVALKAAKMQKLNTKGEMLMCKFTLQVKKGAPDPLCFAVNEETYALKRGVEVTVPWYIVAQFKNNIERTYYQKKDETGKNQTYFEDSPSESFNYMPIDPAPGVTV